MFKRFFRIRIRSRRCARKPRSKFRASQSLHLLHKEVALALVSSRLTHFNSFYNYKYSKITIKNQSSRWGSCSRKGNLNFNYRIALLPSELADYIIVHELCHLGEFNHSRAFWNLVEKTIPNWQVLRNELKKKGKELF